MSDRTLKKNEAPSKYDRRDLADHAVGTAVSGHNLQIHADYAIWDATDNKFVNPEKLTILPTPRK